MQTYHCISASLCCIAQSRTASSLFLWSVRYSATATFKSRVEFSSSDQDSFSSFKGPVGLVPKTSVYGDVLVEALIVSRVHHKVGPRYAGQLFLCSTANFAKIVCVQQCDFLQWRYLDYGKEC